MEEELNEIKTSSYKDSVFKPLGVKSIIKKGTIPWLMAEAGQCEHEQKGVHRSFCRG
jgi:hypothetical protein